MATVPAKASKGRRNVLRKAADSDVHPAEPRTSSSASSARSSRSAGSTATGRVTGRAGGTGGGGRTARD